jgi:hypothetical protein
LLNCLCSAAGPSEPSLQAVHVCLGGQGVPALVRSPIPML